MTGYATRWLLSAVSVLAVIVSGCSAPRSGGEPASAEETAARPALEVVPAPRSGVSLRADCAKVAQVRLLGLSCGPRVPTAVPPRGEIRELLRDSTAKPTITLMLCSAVPDADVGRLLRGEFRAWVEADVCHFDRPLDAARSINRVTVSLTVTSTGDFVKEEADRWVDSSVGPVFGGYVEPTPNQTRWFRFGLSPDRQEPGTLLVLFEYQQLDSDLNPLPAPPEVLAGWNELATLIAQYLTRPA